MANAERDGVRAAYNRAEYLPERWKMMQAWAEYPGTLREGAQIVSIRGVVLINAAPGPMGRKAGRVARLVRHPTGGEKGRLEKKRSAGGDDVHTLSVQIPQSR